MDSNLQKDVLIFTNFKSTTNYGAILQAYALNKYIRIIGFNCKTVNLLSTSNKESFLVYALKKISSHTDIKGIAKWLNLKIKRFLIKQILLKREKLFNNFREEYIPHTNTIYRSNLNNFDYSNTILVCGSDQIWRPSFAGHFDDAMWLHNIKGGKKISYAPSLGVTSLSYHQTKYAECALRSFDSISVREKTAQSILQPLVDKKIEKVLDPVFLLSREEWIHLIDEDTRSFNPSEDYSLLYFLHPSFSIYNDLKRTFKTKFYILTYNSQFNLVDLFVRGKKIKVLKPSEFLHLIKNAKYVFTDSFHATAFSIIFQRNFLYFAFNYSTRIRSLLRDLDLESRIVEKNDQIKITEIGRAQWEKSYSLLNIEINNSQRFLTNSLIL